MDRLTGGQTPTPVRPAPTPPPPPPGGGTWSEAAQRGSASRAYDAFQQQMGGRAADPRVSAPVGITESWAPFATRDDAWRDAWTAASTDYRYGPHEQLHTRVAVMNERLDAVFHTPVGYTLPDGGQRVAPFDHDAAARYIRQIAADVVDSERDSRSASQPSGSRGVYAPATVAAAKKVIAARDSSAAGADVPDYFRSGPYDQPDGSTAPAWFVNAEVNLLLFGVATDLRTSRVLQAAHADQTARQDASRARATANPFDGI